MVTQPYSSEPSFEERMEQAYARGREARCEGRPRSACPHSKGTPAAIEWESGWREASVEREVV